MLHKKPLGTNSSTVVDRRSWALLKHHMLHSWIFLGLTSQHTATCQTYFHEAYLKFLKAQNKILQLHKILSVLAHLRYDMFSLKDVYDFRTVLLNILYHFCQQIYDYSEQT